VSEEEVRSEKQGPLSLNLAESTKRRGCAWLVIPVLLGAAVGGVVGLIGGRMPGLVSAAAVIIVMAAFSFGIARRSVWLEGSHVVARTFFRKRVDLHLAEQIELLITDVRGMRTVGLLITGPPKGKTINLSVATYSGTGYRELGILVLRRLADVLSGSENTAGLVYSQLLVAQLRAEAKGEAAGDRPLYRLASVAPPGRLAQRLRPDAVSRFVATLD
jgi:hypothetical protein